MQCIGQLAAAGVLWCGIAELVGWFRDYTVKRIQYKLSYSSSLLVRSKQYLVTNTLHL